MQVAQSVAYVETGVTHLTVAKRLRKRNRRCLSCLLIFIILAAVVIAIVVAVTVTNNTK